MDLQIAWMQLNGNANAFDWFHNDWNKDVDVVINWIETTRNKQTASRFDIHIVYSVTKFYPISSGIELH